MMLRDFKVLEDAYWYIKDGGVYLANGRFLGRMATPEKPLGFAVKPLDPVSRLAQKGLMSRLKEVPDDTS